MTGAPRPCVLIVEDDQLLLYGLGEALDAAGYETALAESGAAALALLEQLTPDAIVSDIVMPEPDGYGLLCEVRARPELATVPFIFLTARGERDEVREGMASGADDYIAKPFCTDELLRAITARIERRREWDQVQARARESWVQKLAATLHHELRTPLAEIAAYAELLAGTERAMKAGEFDSIVLGLEHGVARLAGLVADVLLLTDLQSGRARTDFQARRRLCADWSDVVRAVAGRFEGLAAGRGLRLVTRCGDCGVVDADPIFLADALARLVDNAVKFSPEGGEVRLVGSTSGDSLELSVVDEGPGYDQDRLDRLFQPFEQGNRELREQQGLGNGLAICRALVELHGGSLRAEALPERGSRFTIAIPLVGSGDTNAVVSA